MLCGHGSRYFWLPRWLLGRSVKRSQGCTTLQWLHRPARFIDRWIRPRLTILNEGPGISAFGLSLIAHDGLLALVAFLLAMAAFGAVTYSLMV